MQHVITTGLDFTNSKYALNEAFKVYSTRFAEYSPSFDWKTDCLARFGFKAMGSKIEGLILVDVERLVLDMTVPFMMRPFQSKAIKAIEDEVNIWVERVKKTSSMTTNQG